MINPKAYTEVNEIIKSMLQEMQNQIPETLRKTIEYNMDPNYPFEIKDFEELHLLKDTEKVLSVLYTDYFATPEERQVILAKEKQLENRKKLEKQEKYPADFMKSKSQKQFSKENKEKSLIVKKEKLYMRAFRRIKEWFGLA